MIGFGCIRHIRRDQQDLDARSAGNLFGGVAQALLMAGQFLAFVELLSFPVSRSPTSGTRLNLFWRTRIAKQPFPYDFVSLDKWRVFHNVEIVGFGKHASGQLPGGHNFRYCT